MFLNIKVCLNLEEMRETKGEQILLVGVLELSSKGKRESHCTNHTGAFKILDKTNCFELSSGMPKYYHRM